METEKQKEGYIVFRLAGELYGIPILSVREIIELQEIKPVLFAPKYYLGIINLRGKIVSVLDLKKKFNMTKTSEEEVEGLIMILDTSVNEIGVIIDETLGVKQIDPNAISFNPVSDSLIKSDYLIGATRINNQLVSLIELNKLIDVEEINNFKT